MILPLILLLLAMLHAGRTGMASLFAMQAGGALDSWTLSKVKPRSDEIRKSLYALETAIWLDSGNPSFLENLARLRMVEAETDQAHKEIHLRAALSAIRQAIALRPVSPYSWGILLVAKSRLNEIDPEFYRALANATFLGPWEPEVQLEVARAGIEHWGRMDFQQREDVRKDISRAMKWHSDDIKRIVFSRQCGYCP